MNGHVDPSSLRDSMRIHIIGAGMGGMGTALSLAKQGFTNITVWESAKALGEVGAGINIPPNLGRLLDFWGVYHIVQERGVVIDKANVLDCGKDNILSTVNYEDFMQQQYGYPFLTVHRAALQQALLQGAMKSGVVDLRLGQRIEEYDFDETRLRVKGEDGTTQWINADVILAADGVKSKAREAMMLRHGEVDVVEDTGQAAYRIMVRRSAIKEDPELVPFFTGAQSYRWIGEGRHIISYPIEAGDLYNMSTIQPDRKFVEADSWTAYGSKDEMLEIFHDFCPRVQKLLNLVPTEEVLEWKLRVHKPLASWTDHNVALIGDACHPTLPHIAQGAAQAIEDAAALGVVLGKVRRKEDIAKALLVYQAVRKPRTDWAVMTAASNTKGLLVKDKEARDKLFEQAQKDGSSNPDKMISRDILDILYTYDVVTETEQSYDKLFAAADGSL